MIFSESWKQARIGANSAKKLRQSMKKQHGLKYESKVDGRGKFYFDGLMYHTDDGTLVNPVGDVDIEFIKMGILVEGLSDV